VIPAPKGVLIVIVSATARPAASVTERWVVPESLGDPRIISTDELTAERVDLIIGFGLGDISMPANQAFRAAILEPPPLAGHALILQEHRQGEWDPSGLVRPLYLQALSAAQPATAA